MKRLHYHPYDVEVIRYMDRRAEQLASLRRGDAYAPRDLNVELLEVLYNLAKFQAWKDGRWMPGVWSIVFQSTLLREYARYMKRWGRDPKLSRRQLNYDLAALERDRFIKRQPRPKPLHERTPGRVRFNATCYTLLPAGLLWIKRRLGYVTNPVGRPRVQNFAQSLKIYKNPSTTLAGLSTRQRGSRALQSRPPRKIARG